MRCDDVFILPDGRCYDAMLWRWKTLSLCIAYRRRMFLGYFRSSKRISMAELELFFLHSRLQLRNLYTYNMSATTLNISSRSYCQSPRIHGFNVIFVKCVASLS